MKAKQLLHQAKLSEWSEIFSSQASSGLTAKEWCVRNDISIHAFNYWKHQLKQSVVDSMLPDIVPVTPSLLVSPPVSNDSLNSLDSCKTLSVLTVSYKDIRIEFGSSSSEQQILQVIRAVRYA